jgi:transposase-like protein
MIDYETYCKIIRMRQDNLRVSQISAALGLDERTVVHWIEEGCFRQRKKAQRLTEISQCPI